MTNVVTLVNASYDKARFDLDAFDSIAALACSDESFNASLVSASLDAMSDNDALCYLDSLAQRRARHMRRVYNELNA